MAFERFFEYKAAIDEILDINDYNFVEKAKRLPSYKHYWAAKLIEHKREVALLEKSLENHVAELQNDREIELSAHSIKKRIENSPAGKKIKEKIEEEKFIIEYLQLACNVLTYATNDIKNVIETKKLELL